MALKRQTVLHSRTWKSHNPPEGGIAFEGNFQLWENCPDGAISESWPTCAERFANPWRSDGIYYARVGTIHVNRLKKNVLEKKSQFNE